MSKDKQIRIYRPGARNGWSDTVAEWDTLGLEEAEKDANNRERTWYRESQKRMETCIQYSFAARLYGFQAEGSTRQLQGNRGELEFQSSLVPGGDAKSVDTKSHDTKSHDETFTSPPLMQRLGALQD